MAGGRDPDRASRRAFKLREPPRPLPLPLPLPAEASRWRGGAPAGPSTPPPGNPRATSGPDRRAPEPRPP